MLLELDKPQKLSPRAQVLWVLKGFYFVIFVVIVFYLGIAAKYGGVPRYGWLALLVATGALLFNIAASRLMYLRFNYIFRATGIEIESGVIFRRRVLIPYQSIQRTETFQDIWERILGICDIILEVSAPINSQSSGEVAYGVPAIRRATVVRLNGVAKADTEIVLKSISEYTSKCNLELGKTSA